MQNGYEGQTTLEASQNKMLDFALEQRHKVTSALDYLDIALTVPMDDESYMILSHVQGILLGVKG